MMNVKTAKGTRDLTPFQMRIREKIINEVKDVFKLHNAEEIDTPVFELTELLTSKYGNDNSKLIYDLQDQGGELLSLRYDLTVPFARYVASHGITSMKRYQIGKVYRRDQPAIDKGRFREFYQCDFDICGNSPLMFADAEVLSVLQQILDKLVCIINESTNEHIDYTIKLSNRKLLEFIVVDVVGIDVKLFKTTCSSIDKLDKLPWVTVKNELISKGVEEDKCDKLYEFIGINGGCYEVLQQLRLVNNESMNGILDEMELLFQYLDALDVINKVSFDLSLARGLDYYTGIIIEAVINETSNKCKIGSVAGGGRYDNLIGMFSRKQVPSVGMSIGIERIFAIMEKKLTETISECTVYICTVFKPFLKERLIVARQCWNNNISCCFSNKNKPSLKEQLGEANSKKCKYAIIIAPDELERNEVKIKDLTNNCECIANINNNDIIHMFQ